MSSSTFEVKESESDSEKVHDFGLDSCEENGIMSSQTDGELPKDHTYTKEPDVSQEDGMKDNGLSSSSPEDMDNLSTVKKPKTSRVTGKSPSKKMPVKTTKKTIAKSKAKVKKDSIVKDLIPDASPSKKNKGKKEEEEANLTGDNPDNGEVADDNNAETSNTTETESKTAKRGRKRKVEEKENVENEEILSTKANSSNDGEKSPKRKATIPRAKAAAVNKSDTKGKNISVGDGEIDHDNLPKGWLRKKVVRKSGKTAGHIDVYIYSPDGFKLRSKPDIIAYLERTNSPLKIEDFGLTSGKATKKSSPSVTPNKNQKKKIEKPKTPEKKKPQSPKKSPKLLVKIVSAKSKKNRVAKANAEAKESKSEEKGKGKAVSLKGGKKKKNA